jgi:serine/threonine protein kinase
MQGTRLGKYEILDKLGEGGMGEVWRARDESLNRMVAVKILPPELSRDPGRRIRFEQEARALGALNHPNIVAVYEAGQDDGRAYLISELVDGESLRAILDRGRPPLRKLIEMGVQIAEAMAAAHAVGIVHRDLKPENIMVTRGGLVKVLDFGLAKQTINAANAALDATVAMTLTQPGIVMGTAGYMSPEQVRGEPTDHRSDIFSFGAVLYEMIAGKRAFQAGTSAVETMNAILHEDPPAIEADLSGVPPALETVVRRCLEKRPTDRFQSAADLAFALRAIGLSGASGAQAAVNSRTAPWRSRLGMGLIAAVTACALFGAGLFFGTRASHREPPRFQRLTFRHGLVTNARFTDDPHNVVYSANWDGSSGRVFLATPGNPESRDLELPEGSALASVSSKNELAILTGPYTPDGAGTLSRVSIFGGQMRPWLENIRWAEWSPDGSSLAVQRAEKGQYRLEYPVGRTVAGPTPYPFFAFRISPDGTRLAFAHYHQSSSVGISIVDQSGKTRFLGAVTGQTSELADPSLAWSRDGKEIWFRSFDLAEWGTIYAINLSGQRRVVARIPNHVTLYDIGRDGSVLLRTDTRQVGILGKARGDTSERDLSIMDASNLKSISDDGTAIVANVVGEAGGPMGSVYLRKLDGSPAVRLGAGAAFVLSPDGKWVSGYSSKDGLVRQYKLFPTGAGEERAIAIRELDWGLVTGWLPGEQKYLVAGSRHGKKEQCFAWDASSNSLRSICPEGIPDNLLPLSPDRQWVLSGGPDGQTYAYPVAGGTPQLVRGLSPHDQPIGWRADNRSLFLLTHHDTNRTLPVSVLDIQTGNKTSWMEIHPMRPVDEVFNLQIAPDGQAYAYSFRVKASDLYAATGLR